MEEKLNDTVANENVSAEKPRKTRKKRTPEQKKRSRKIALIVLCSVLSVLIVFFSLVAVINVYGTKSNVKKIGAYESVGSELTPYMDEETGCWTFQTDRDFRVLQLTDVHIGGGAFSLQKDAWAADAVYTLIKRVQPDLVIVTGDVAYPVPFQAGTFDNKRSAEVFATLMEKCEVYWTLTFGNHDTELYSMYDRDEMSDFYSQEKWKYCLYEKGPDTVDGCGNYVINVKNSADVITHSMYMLDSHSYVDGDYFGIAWKYDNLHQNQIDWYKSEVERLDAYNQTKGGGEIKSTMYMHIPLVEYRTAWNEYVDNGMQDTADVTFKQGVAGETGKVVYCGIGEDQMFETIAELGNTIGVFCGHDHLNNFSIEYKGVRLTYGMSIDYLAYAGIAKKTAQRGGTIITFAADGSFTIVQERLVK